MLNNGSNMLDEIFKFGENSRNMKDVGFEYSFMNKKIKILTKKLVSPKKKIEFMMKDHMFQHPNQHVYPRNRGNKNPSRKCHHYGRYGYINPFDIDYIDILSLILSQGSTKIKGRKIKQRKCGNPRKLSLVS